MSIFREVREAVRNLGPDDCYGITKCVMLSKQGAMFMNREVFFAKKRGVYKGEEYQRTKYPVNNWRKRLAILESLRV